jgi:hypothetical protein
MPAGDEEIVKRRQGICAAVSDAAPACAARYREGEFEMVVLVWQTVSGQTNNPAMIQRSDGGDCPAPGPMDIDGILIPAARC